MSAPKGFPTLVTGAGGALGRLVVDALLRDGTPARGLGRGPAPDGFPAPWARADLAGADAADPTAGRPLAAALDGVGAVVHCASDPYTPGADVRAARALAAAARTAGVGHLVFVQIAGIEDAAAAFRYYRDKLDAEAAARAGGVPCTVAAATQFHPLVAYLLTQLAAGGAAGDALRLPALTLQPLDPAFFAARLARRVRLGPEALEPPVHGPEALDARQLAAAWQAARPAAPGAHRPVVLVPPGPPDVPRAGPVADVLAAMAKLRPARGVAGGRSWARWLADEPG